MWSLKGMSFVVWWLRWNLVERRERRIKGFGNRLLTNVECVIGVRYLERRMQRVFRGAMLGLAWWTSARGLWYYGKHSQTGITHLVLTSKGSLQFQSHFNIYSALSEPWQDEFIPDVLAKLHQYGHTSDFVAELLTLLDDINHGWYQVSGELDDFQRLLFSYTKHHF